MMGMICNFLLKFAEEKINKETIEKIRQEFNIPNKGFKPEINYPDIGVLKLKLKSATT